MTIHHSRGALLRSAALSVFLYSALMSSTARAQDNYITFNIPPEDLSTAIGDYGHATGLQIAVDDALVRGIRAPGLKGSFSTSAALDRLLSGSGLTWHQSRPGMISITRATAAPQDTAAADSAVDSAKEGTVPVQDVIVTGSRIPGAPQSSPMVIITSADIANAGQIDLGETIRDIPQNFSGGQNPGAGQRSAYSNTSGNSFGGASTLNLRGLGNDATLTLLNGHRLTFDGFSGVDITAIPAVAVDRLEIVTDGASALYGSDAVGGVANVITKQSYNGLTVTALAGGSTDGGYTENQYSIVGGTTWNSGGVIFSATDTRNDAITAAERSYTRGENPASTLYPEQHRLNLFLSAHQDLSNNFQFGIDALYSNSKALQNLAYTLGSLASYGEELSQPTHSFLLAPHATVVLADGWHLDASGTYGGDSGRTTNTIYYQGKSLEELSSCFCNTSLSGEVSAEGPLLTLPAGDVRLALGGGYRSARADEIQLKNGFPSGQGSKGQDNVVYGFGEFSIPLISPSYHIPLVQALSASLAMRYENYNSVGSQATPKLGLIYDLSPSFDLKASWGKSFKAPTLQERFEPAGVYLIPVTGTGTLFPANATALETSGGNPTLKPEKATSATLTAEYHPQFLPGLRISADYFHIDFTNRVAEPVMGGSLSLLNPQYSTINVLYPSSSLQADTISKLGPLVNIAGVPYNAANVVAIIDEQSINVASQEVNGFDFSLAYRLFVSRHDTVTFNSSSTYLDITQRLTPGSASQELAGNFYEPRHFISRDGVTWSHQNLTLSTFLNYVGAAKYRMVTPYIPVRGNTTIDLVGRGMIPHAYGTSITLSVFNLFNSKPTVVPGQPQESSYDATAYSAVGRAITVAVSKSF